MKPVETKPVEMKPVEVGPGTDPGTDWGPAGVPESDARHDAPALHDVPAGDEAPSRPGVPTWEEVAQRDGGFLYTLAYRLTADRYDAEDLVQETLLRVRRGLRSYQPGSFEGWLARITTNAFIDQTRRRRRRPELALPDDVDRRLPPAPGADEAWAGARLGTDVQAALMGLPLEYRVPLVLCDIAGRSYLEIAETLDIPIGTVRSRIHRGRSALREALG